MSSRPRPRLRLRYPFKTPIGDILHRTLIYSLVGVTVWGSVMIGLVHRDTLRRGEEALRERRGREGREGEGGEGGDAGGEDALKEQALAEQAQAALQGRKFS